MTQKLLKTKKDIESAGISQHQLRNLMIALANKSNLCAPVLKGAIEKIEKKGWSWLIKHSGGVIQNKDASTGEVTVRANMTFLGGRIGNRMLPVKGGCAVM